MEVTRVVAIVSEGKAVGDLIGHHDCDAEFPREVPQEGARLRELGGSLG
jgi:hypothetical protein